MSIITDCPYICAPNIMDTPDYTTKTVALDMTGKTVIKAGTPISADGKVANDETAIGIKGLIGGIVSVSNGVSKVIDTGEFFYPFVGDDGFSIGASKSLISVAYKDNAAINGTNFPQKGVYFRKSDTEFVSSLSYAATNESDLVVEFNSAFDEETKTSSVTLATPMCFIKEAAGRAYIMKAVLASDGMKLASFSALFMGNVFVAMFAMLSRGGGIAVITVECTAEGVCSVTSGVLQLTSAG